MILLDTHIWVWYLNGSSILGEREQRIIADNAGGGFAVSMISYWEVAKLVEVQRISLSQPVEDWINTALSHQNIQSINLTTRIVVESTQLPQPFHRDPADQIIVATARVLGIPLLTMDGKILAYPHVRTL
jgi:PIN domain nuclease of toxin-antitoxin system